MNKENRPGSRAGSVVAVLAIAASGAYPWLTRGVIDGDGSVAGHNALWRAIVIAVVLAIMAAGAVVLVRRIRHRSGEIRGPTGSVSQDPLEGSRCPACHRVLEIRRSRGGSQRGRPFLNCPEHGPVDGDDAEG